MIYILYGLENTLIDDFVSKTILKEKFEDIIKYDLNISKIEEVIEDASYNDLFNSKKLVIAYNSNFLSTKSFEDSLKVYLMKPNENNHIMFILNEDKINDNNEIVQLIKENYIIKEFNKLTSKELEKYIRNEFVNEDYNISDDAVNLIIELLDNNLSLIKNELHKLKLYKIDDKNIDETDVKNVVSRSPEEDIFTLVNAIVNKDKKLAFNIYKDLSNNEDEIKILSVISSQIRLLYQVKLLSSVKTKDDISTILGVHPYRVKIALEKIKNFSDESLSKLLEMLFEIDLNIKSGKIDKSKSLELFFLEL